jgi:hypothetical protein
MNDGKNSGRTGPRNDGIDLIRNQRHAKRFDAGSAWPDDHSMDIAPSGTNARNPIPMPPVSAMQKHSIRLRWRYEERASPNIQRYRSSALLGRRAGSVWK